MPIQNKELSKEYISFTDGIFITKVQATEGYTLKNLKVYGNNKHITLDAWGGAGEYFFQIPKNIVSEASILDDNQEKQEVPFVASGVGFINIEAYFTKEQVAGWTYNYNYKRYVLDLEDDIVLDDSNENLNLIKHSESDLGTRPNDTVNYSFFLNDKKVKVGTFTIPHGVTITLINNRTNANPNNDEKQTRPNVITQSYDKMNGQEGFRIAGVLAEYSSVRVDAPINSYGVTPRK